MGPDTMLDESDSPQIHAQDGTGLPPQNAGAVPAEAERPPRKSRARRWLLSFLMLAGLGAGSVWWFETHGTPAVKHHAAVPEPAVNVSVGEVKQGDMPVALDALGTVTSLATITLRPQVSGRITEVGFKEGQYVKAGDFLIQIDPRPYQAALDQASGQLARDEALLGVARLDQKRYETLLKQDSIARQQVDTQRSLVHQDEAIVRADKAAVETAKLNLEYSRIVSPVDGRIGLRIVDPGNFVQPSNANGLVIVTQTKPISVIFPLPQDTIPQFIGKLRAGEKLPVLAYNRSGNKLLATGELSNADNQVDTTTGTVRLRARFENKDEALYPNQFVNVKLIVDKLHDVAIAPASAIQLGAVGHYVYVANDNGTVSVRPVTVGPAEGQKVAILEGLSAGEKVVVDGADRLRDGARYSVVQPSKPGKPVADASGGGGAAGQSSRQD